MALFAALTAKEKTAPIEVDEIGKLRAELARQKDAARLRARYGPQLTDAAIDEMLAGEADMVVRKAKAKEATKINLKNEADLDVAYRNLACKLVADQKMIISIDGSRLATIDPTLLILCPHCSKPLGDLSDAVYQFAKTWHWCAESARVDTFLVYSARSPLTEQGFAGFISHKCPSCEKRVKGIVQMVVV